MIDVDSIREKVLRRGQIIDRHTIRDRVFRRDISFSDRVVLTALIKCDVKIRDRLLKELSPEYFGRSLFSLIFEWIIQSLRSKGEVDKVELYQRIDDYVRNHVMPEDMAFIDQLLTIETPDEETVDRAITCLQKLHAGQIKFGTHNEEIQFSQRVVLTALIKCDAAIRQRILKEMNPEHFPHLTLALMFEWASQLLHAKDKLDAEELYRKTEDYVWNQVRPGYTAVLDHLLAIETPDEETVERAIALLQERHIHRGTTRSKADK
jgi:replicative DNA helicase